MQALELKKMMILILESLINRILDENDIRNIS